MSSTPSAATISMLPANHAIDALKDRGWRILGADVATKHGTLDVIARRDATVLYVVTRRLRGPVDATRIIGSVDGRDRHRARRAAVIWMATHPRDQVGVQRYRFDVIAVVESAAGDYDCTIHVPDAF